MAQNQNIEAAGRVDKCIGCNLCVNECSFLQRTANPRDLATGKVQCDPFECTLCGLCAAVCPVDVDPSRYFLERRREARRAKGSDDRRHAPLLSYEKKGTSRLFTFYGLPEGCDTIFFPGCALPGTRPHAVSKVYERLKKEVPNLGIVLDCCLKPSHDLGREEHFNESFREITHYLQSQGIRKVLVACPNCNRIFSDYGGTLTVQTVYEILAELPGETPETLSTEAVFHDPCVARNNIAAQEAARKVVERSGVAVAEMKHSRKLTQCCGRGGGVNFIRPGVIDESVASRVAEAAGRPIVTYCAACAGTYQKSATALHLLDLWMEPREALAGKAKVSVAPVTYLNRLRLKSSFRKCGDFAVMRERGGREIPLALQPRLQAVRLLLLVSALLGLTGAVQIPGPGASSLVAGALLTGLAMLLPAWYRRTARSRNRGLDIILPLE